MTRELLGVVVLWGVPQALGRAGVKAGAPPPPPVPPPVPPPGAAETPGDRDMLARLERLPAGDPEVGVCGKQEQTNGRRAADEELQKGFPET